MDKTGTQMDQKNKDTNNDAQGLTLERWQTDFCLKKRREPASIEYFGVPIQGFE